MSGTLSISGLSPGGQVSDPTAAQQQATGIPNLVVSPFTSLVVSDSDPVTTTVWFSGNGFAALPETGMTEVADGGGSQVSEWTVSGSSSQVQAVLRGAEVELGAVGSARAQEGYGNNEIVGLTVADTVTGATATAQVTYQEVAPPSVVLGSGVTMIVPSGASATGVEVNSGGQLDVNAGGTAYDTVVNAGGHLANNATATGTALDGGTMWDNAGGTASNTVVNAGGNEIVYAGSTALNTLVNSGGIVTDSSGTVTQSQIGSGGFQGIWGHESGSIIYAGGEQALYNGGNASGDTVLGGVEFIRAGGTASNETIAGGKLTVAGGSLTGGVTFNGSGQLTLATDSLGATIKGFAATDQIDLAGLGFGAGAKETFAGGTLTVASGANHAALTFGGAYNTADFGLSNDGAGGTLVKFV